MTTANGTVTLPTDAGNTGSKMRTITRTVGANTVHEHFYIPSSSRDAVTGYSAVSAALTVQATAHTFGTSGFLWFINPAGSSIIAAVEKMEVQSQLGSALAATSSPRLLWTKFSFTGTASGATVTPAKLDTNFANAQCSLRTAITGMTLTNLGDVWCTLPTASATAVGYAPPHIDDWNREDEDGQLILRASEGICFYQPDAGTTSDTRRIIAEIYWHEFN